MQYYKIIVHYCFLLAIVAVGITVPFEAFAGNVTTLYSGDVQNCASSGLDNLFSSFVCNYHLIVDQIMTRIYYAMVNSFTQPFMAALTLAVIVGGTTFGLGMLPFTTRDIMLLLAKIALLTGFAIYPQLMIDLAYYGLIGFMKETTDITIASLAPPGINNVGGIFEWMDAQLAEFLNNHETARTTREGDRAADSQCDNDILALLFGLAVTMPPVFAIAMYLLIQFVMVFVRTVLGYLVAITGIMFLTTLAPIFLGFGLFNFTRSYFEKWLSYMIAFSVQIFIVFAFIAVVLSLPFGEKIRAVNTIIKPVDKVAYHDGQRVNYDNWCSICQTTSNPLEVLEADSCSGDEITPTNIQGGGVGTFIQWVGEELLILAVMAYLVESILKAAPQVSKYLTNTPYASAFNGKLPMQAQLENAGRAGRKAINNAPGGAGSKYLAGFKDATSSLITGR